VSVRTVDPWAEVIGLASLHACRTPDDLDRELQQELQRLQPELAMALCVAADGKEQHRVQVAFGEGCPLQRGQVVGGADWPLPEAQQLPIRYRSHVLGVLLVGSPVEDEDRTILGAVLAHYGAALVNLTLNEESRQATEHYCASLQALEEGIVLFQEEDPEAVMARLLNLATTMVQATAGALYVLREVGNPASGLALEQALGIPDSLLGTFHGKNGCQWPEVLVGESTQVVERDLDGSMAMLAAECVPAILHNVVVLPLRYHGVEAGLCVLFNAAIDVANARDHLGRVQSLGQLGAALLHRLRLEALTARNRSIARELQIAETIQKRLLPTHAPVTNEYTFAWCSIAAQSIGGDYLDLLTSDLGDIYAVVADASGHGINSALLMSSFRSTYRADAPWMECNELAESLNDEVANEVGATGMFITAVMLRIERETRQLSICSAGHNPVMLFRLRTRTVEMIDSHGPPLGFLERAEYEVQGIQLEAGDVLMLYTDGITEATDGNLDMFGEERLIALLRQHADAGAEVLLQASRRALAEFTGRDSYEDDVSITVIKVT
jgi:serine phosphatase RsbU (regulator of sigma subunit)